MSSVRLTQLDGKLPNLALMKLAAWHLGQGDDVTLARTPSPSMFESQYDVVYGSAIFAWTAPVVERLLEAFPNARVGGTWSDDWTTVEQVIGRTPYEHYDYSIYPEYEWSLGFTQRGCRLNCGFCVVPKKEGRPVSTNTIWDIWRPETPRCVVLLDNDFFGQAEDQWRARIDELRDGDFKVSFNQGINIRLINEASAAAVASVRYYDDQFKKRRLYTAWDNIGQEDIFFRGIAALEEAGVPPRHVMAYMLVGYDPKETWEAIFHRYQRMKDLGVMPYPMVYNNARKDLKRFQKWVVMRFDEVVTWKEFTGGSMRSEMTSYATPSSSIRGSAV